MNGITPSGAFGPRSFFSFAARGAAAPSPPAPPPTRRPVLLRAAGLLLPLLLAPSARSTIGPSADLEGALARTDEAALVRVVNAESSWRGRTLVLAVRAERVRADAALPAGGRDLAWLQPGGRARDPRTGLAVRMVVPGLPAVAPGDEFVVLLTRRGGSRVLADAVFGLLPVRREAGGRALVSVPGRASPLPAGELLSRVARQGPAEARAAEAP
jgi:hypothetical protein